MKLFTYLNDTSFVYGVLRNYTKLPEVSGDDIDIYIDVLDFDHLIKSLRVDFIFPNNWEYKVKYKNKNFLSIVCYNTSDENIETLQLDFYNDFTWRGISYVNLDHLKQRLEKHQNFNVVCPGSECAITFVKELLGYGNIREKHRIRIASVIDENSEDFYRSIDMKFRSEIKKVYKAYSLDCENKELHSAARQVKSVFIKRCFHLYLWSTIHSIGRVINRVFRRKQLIVFLGPDGSGKSTLIDNYAVALDRFYPDRINVYHRRYNIFPDLKTNRGFSSMKGKIKPGSTQKVKRSFLSVAATMVVVAYYTLEYFIGNYIVQRNRMAGRLVLFDRYYYDHFIQPTSRDLITPVKWVLLFFVARPSLIVHLRASASEIYKRKKDLPEKEIELQNKYIDLVLKSQNNVIRLDSVKYDQNELVKQLFVETIDKLKFYK